MKPRPYQVQAVEATLDALFNMEGKSPIVALPTGTGKSSVLSWTTRAIMQRVPSARVFHCTHVKELISQDSSELQAIWPNAPFGIYSAGLNSKQAAMPITFASVMSAVKHIEDFGKQSVMMIDEAHLLAPQEESSYQKLIRELRKRNPNMPVVGYSATAWRMGSGRLTEGNIFNHTAIDLTEKDEFVRFIDDGYLSPLIPKNTSFKFDVSQVRKVGDDYNRGDLERVVNVDEHTLQALQESLQVLTNRNHIMVFCAGIDHVESVTAMLQMFGENAVCVHSKMSAGQRDAAIQAFKLGHARWIVNDGVLATGFNSPWIDAIVMLRPSISVVRHVQSLGRGTRPVYHPSFTYEMLEDRDMRLQAIEMSTKPFGCMVLDFAGNTLRLGPINDPRIPKKKGKGTGDVPVKICPMCNSYVHAAVRFCDGVNWDNTKCNHEFIFETKLEQTAATVELIARDVPMLDWFKVDRVEYDVRQRAFQAPMMRVKYYSGMRRFTELVCIEHTTWAGKRARDWWRQRLELIGLGHVAPPPTTEKGIEFAPNLPMPTHIHVWLNASGGRHENVTACSFDGTMPTQTIKQPSRAA